MKNFLLGLAAGVALGSATSAVAAKMVGDNGYLFGYDVKIDGEVVCSDPWIWGAPISEIEC